MKRAQKLESKLDIILGGYQKKAGQTQQETKAAFDELVNAQDELVCFRSLQNLEKVGLPLRLQVLTFRSVERSASRVLISCVFVSALIFRKRRVRLKQ